MLFQNKVVLITGASSGIGKALAYSFAKEGAILSLSARNFDSIEEIKSHLPDVKINCVRTDVTNESDCKNFIEESIKVFGKVDVLICNAGISMRAIVDEVETNVLHQVMNVNFWGAVYCVKYALPYLLKSKGSVVGISSIAGKKGLPGRSAYSASKFAMEGFMESLRIENIEKNLHVLVACPGFTASNIRKKSLTSDGSAQSESPREENKMMSAEEVARHIVLATAKRKRDLILSTNGKLTVFLNKIIPGISDRLVLKFMKKEPGSPF
ncbi:MAG TPA: SDR family oxidoreductase [Bacteroidia bacterium]|nr:SDR family oxidoreductase [Bacteroidia bacterium]